MGDDTATATFNVGILNVACMHRRDAESVSREMMYSLRIREPTYDPPNDNVQEVSFAYDNPVRNVPTTLTDILMQSIQLGPEASDEDHNGSLEEALSSHPAIPFKFNNFK